jgi:hypothetical protein
MYKSLLLIILLLSISLISNNDGNEKDHEVDKRFIGKTRAEIEAELFDSYIEKIYNEVGLEGKLSFRIFKTSFVGYMNTRNRGLVAKPIMTIVDFRQPSSEKRFYCLDLDEKKLLHRTYVSHGENTGGDKYVVEFSNEPNSYKSSLGFFKTAETYSGKNGYSLRLDGLDISFNDNARVRNIVVHGAHYVNDKLVKKNGFIGKSQGCPAIPMDIYESVINDIKEGTLLFLYASNREYLSSSSFLDFNRAKSHYFDNRGVFK